MKEKFEPSVEGEQKESLQEKKEVLIEQTEEEIKKYQEELTQMTQENKVEKEKDQEFVFEKPNTEFIKMNILNHEIESPEDFYYLKNLAEDLLIDDLEAVTSEISSRLVKVKEYIKNKDIPEGPEKLRMVARINDYEKLFNELTTLKKEKIDFERENRKFMEVNKGKFLEFWDEFCDKIKRDELDYVNDTDIEEMMAVFFDIKPAVALEFDEKTDFNSLIAKNKSLLKKYGYDTVANEEGDMLIVYDGNKVADVMDDNIDVFSDYDQEKNDIHDEMEKIFAEDDVDKFYLKTGLVLGYPRQSCDDFVQMLKEGTMDKVFEVKAPGIVYRKKEPLTDEDYEIIKKHKRTFQLADIDKLTI